MLIDVPITVIINVITLLRGGRATGPTLITDTLVDHPITVIVKLITATSPPQHRPTTMRENHMGGRKHGRI